MMPLRRILFLAVALAVPPTFPQTTVPAAEPAAAALPVFDVISVKPDKDARGWRDRVTPDGFSATGITVKVLLMEAYGISADSRVIAAPQWADENKYDIDAKVGGADVAALKRLGPEQRTAMAQQILTDRFSLKVHREDRSQPIYSLVVAKPGVLKPTPPAADGKRNDSFRSERGQLTATGFSTAQLAQLLSGHLGRIVVDNTGLTGGYDVRLRWNLDDTATTGVGGSDSSAPSMFTAVQEQLGLKLVSTKGPVECLVIDHMELPTEN